jgi:hypothetical protein
MLPLQSPPEKQNRMYTCTHYPVNTEAYTS